MEAKLFRTLPSKSSTIFILPKTAISKPIFLPHQHSSLRTSPIKSNTGNNNSSTSSKTTSGDAEMDTPTPVPPPEMVEIRFRRGSRRRSREMEGGATNGQAMGKAKPPPPPKVWEEMTLSEKAVELYMGEKGLLFWLNKFAYASIFIIIGAWILFRFVGPSLNLYQLDAPPLSPSSALKGGG